MVLLLSAACFSLPWRAAAQVRIDEILADPPPGLAGDANGDGRRGAFEDEFIELFNAGPHSVDLSGWRLSDDDTAEKKQFRFPSGTLLPAGGRTVLFGGGRPGGFAAPVFVDDGRIGNGLSNGGDTVFLIDAAGDTVEVVRGSKWKADQSQVRRPAGSGDFVPHAEVSGGIPFSPAAPLPAEENAAPTPEPPEPAPAMEPEPTPEPPEPEPTPETEAPAVNAPPHFVSSPVTRVRAGFVYRYLVEIDDPEGNSLALHLDRAPVWLELDVQRRLLHGRAPGGPEAAWPVRLRLEDGTHTLVQEFVLQGLPAPALLVSEILADPPADPTGDANGDGHSDRQEDEFIELFNAGPDTVDLSGWRLSDDDTTENKQFHFPPGTRLASGQYLVLFGGGRPRGVPGLVFADDGRIGNGLGNGGDRILLIAADPPDTLVDFSYTSPPNLDQSLVRSAGGLYLPHRQPPGRGLFSPGRPRPLYEAFAVETPELVPGASDSLHLRGRFAGSDERLDPTLLLWAALDTQVVALSRKGRIRALRPGSARVEAWSAGPYGSFLASVRMRVLPPPPPPNEVPAIFSTPDTSAYAGSFYRYTIEAADPEGATLTYTLFAAPAWLALPYGSLQIQGRIPLEAAGAFSIGLEVNDGRGGLASQRYTLRVLPRPELRISEVLADPPAGPAGDANGDGRRHPFEDEFVEFYNAGPDTVDLSGWRLGDGHSAEHKQFHFPPDAHLPPGEYALVFGAGGRGEHSFAAGGRIGDGLGNRRDAIYLITPSGADTLARARYALERDPGQSLSWPGGDTAPVLHGQWPGAELFSPGRPRPLVQELQLRPSRLDLVAGRRAALEVVGLFSDGRTRPVRQAAIWHSSRPKIARADSTGLVSARAGGRGEIWVRIDPLTSKPSSVRVRPPLRARLRLTPAWERQTLPAGRKVIFGVQATGAESLAYAWSLNGRSLESTASHLVHTFAAAVADTVRLEVHSAGEVLSRAWTLLPNHPPTLQLPRDSVARAGQLYQLQLEGRDPENDPLLYQLLKGPPGMNLHPSSGLLTWRPAPGRSGRVLFRVRLQDTYHAVAQSGTLRVQSPAAKELGASFPAPRSWPNPFNSSTIIAFHLPEAAPARLRIYAITGQLVRTLLDGPLPPGSHRILWDGRDDAGRALASGLYLYHLQRGSRLSRGKLLLLR